MYGYYYIKMQSVLIAGSCMIFPAFWYSHNYETVTV